MNIIVDLEHTISNAWHRIKKSKDRGINFQEEFVNDRPNNNIIMFMSQLMDNDSNVIILSAKREKYRQLVINWLNLHSVQYTALIMKPDDLFNYSADEFKKTFIDSYKHKIDFALDDVGRNCAMFANNNIPCLRIEQR